MKELPERYPELVDITLIESLIALMQERILNNSAVLVSVSFSSLMNLAVIVVYTVLVPILIFLC